MDNSMRNECRALKQLGIKQRKGNDTPVDRMDMGGYGCVRWMLISPAFRPNVAMFGTNVDH